MSHFLVTGGCGFIGSHLVASLLANGHRVRVLDDLSTGKRANLSPGAEIMVGDVADREVVGDPKSSAAGLGLTARITLREGLAQTIGWLRGTPDATAFRSGNDVRCGVLL